MPRSSSVPGASLPVQCRMPVPPAAEEALGELACRAPALLAASGGDLLTSSNITQAAYQKYFYIPCAPGCGPGQLEI